MENSILRQANAEGANNGYMVVGVDDGNQFLVRFSGTVGPVGPDNTGPLNGRFVVVDGTGPDFSGAIGSGTYTGTADFAHQRFTITAAGAVFLP